VHKGRKKTLRKEWEVMKKENRKGKIRNRKGEGKVKPSATAKIKSTTLLLIELVC